jgi:UDP-GlcNAc:undecaprenyl-phosphate GlcNAc-1-phosphate transferase
MNYLIYFISSLVLSLITIPLVLKYALKNKIVSLPGGRNIHTKPTARLGGLAVFISFWLVIISIIVFNPLKLSFVGEKFLGIDKNLFGVMAGSSVLLIVGLIDDIKGMKPSYKLIGHFLASVIVVFFGIKIMWIHNPLTGIDIVLGNWTYIVVPLWIVLVINVINWLDGVDGLATGVGLIASVILFILSISQEVNQPATGLLSIILAGSLLGFLFFNFNPAKIFLGDIGSMFIGFMLAIFAIISGGKFATAALVLGFPILDTIWVISRRLLNKQPVWQADRRHFHHRLLDAGLSQRQAVIFLYIVSIFFGFIALQSNTREKLYLFISLLLFMVLVGLTLVIFQLKKKVVRS